MTYAARDTKTNKEVQNAYTTSRTKVIGSLMKKNLGFFDAEDILHDATLKLLERGYKEGDITDGLLFVTVYRMHIDKLRRDSRYPVGAITDDLYHLHEKEFHIVDHGFIKLVNKEIDKLMPKHAEALRLRMKGMTYEVIALRMNVQRVTALVYVHQARKKLRKKLKQLIF